VIPRSAIRTPHSATDNRVLERMDRIAENWSLCSILTGAVLAGWVIVASLMVAVVLDMLVQFETWARGVVLAVWCVISVAALLVLMVRPLRRTRTPDGIARRFEEIFPELNSDLINLVQLSRTDGSSSTLLLGGAIWQANKHAAGVPLESAANRLTWRERFRHCMHTPRDLMLSLSVFAAIVIVAGLLQTAFPAWPNSVYRLFHPGRFVPAVGSARILEVTPGDTEVLTGSSLSFAANLDNPHAAPHQGVLVAVAPDGVEQRYALVPSEKFDRYSFTFPKVTDPFRYRLEIGRTQTEHYSVGVFDRPVLRSMTATYLYPAYTGLGEKMVDLKGGALEGPQYTNVDLTLTTAAPVKRAVVKIGGREVSATARQTKPIAHAKFQIVENGSYRVHLTDARGNTNADAQTYPIHVIIDQPPTVEITKPTPEIAAAAGERISLEIRAGDDYGLSLVELRSRLETDSPENEKPVRGWKTFRDPTRVRLHENWKLPESLKAGSVVLYRLRACDNRQATVSSKRIGPQETFTAVRRIRIVDRDAHYADKLKSLERFRQQLWRIYKRQTEARGETVPLTTVGSIGRETSTTANSISAGQQAVKKMTVELSSGVSDKQQALLPFKSALENLAQGRMTEAITLARETAGRNAVEDLHRSASALATVQDDILDVLRKLLDLARAETSRAIAQMEKRPGGDLPDDVIGQLQDLKKGLEKFLKEQRKVIEASEDLAKKPVEDFTEQEEQLLKKLAANQDDWSKFMNAKHSDLSRLPEQDFSNPTMSQELIEIETELKMAADALTKKSTEIAVPLEQLGAEMAEEITTNIEKWLPDTPDREKWSQEEPLTDAMREAPMAELPNELEDLVGDLMEEEEDLFDEMEDVSSSWADSIDKGAGWDAMDGPISNMSAKGVTGNRLPNTSEIGGRSGEGRQGKSSGEFVGDTAVGKGGRKTPSRLTPDPFEKGQVKDTSKDPVGGATGGGKESGQGGEGLEGPIPPPLKRELGRLAGKQASLRNRAETIRLQFKIVNYNTADMDTLIKAMQRVERQLRSGYFRSALRRRDVVLGSLGDLRNQTTDEASVKTDTTASIPQEIRKQILGSMNEASPVGWEQLNKNYFEKIANGK